MIHRIELQEHEREVLDMMAASYSVNKILEPLTSISKYSFVAFTAILGFLQTQNFVEEVAGEIGDIGGVIGNLNPKQKEGIKRAAARRAGEFLIEIQKALTYLP